MILQPQFLFNQARTVPTATLSATSLAEERVLVGWSVHIVFIISIAFDVSQHDHANAHAFGSSVHHLHSLEALCHLSHLSDSKRYPTHVTSAPRIPLTLSAVHFSDVVAGDPPQARPVIAMPAGLTCCCELSGGKSQNRKLSNNFSCHLKEY